MKTPDPQCPGPSVSLIEREETPQNMEQDSDDPEPVAGGDVWMKRPPDKLCSQSIGIVTKNCLQELKSAQGLFDSLAPVW